MESLKRARSQFRRIIFLLALFSLVVNLLMLTMPLYMLQIYDRILPSQSMDTLTYLSVIAAASLVVLGLLEAVRAVLASRAATRIETEMGADVLRMSMNRARMGEPDIQPVRELATVRQFIASRTVFALMDLPFAPLFIGILYVIHPTLFWLTLAGAVVLLIIAIFNQAITKHPVSEAQGRQNMAMTTAQAMARNAHTLRAMGMTNNAIAKWGGNSAQSLIAHGSVDTRNAVLSGLSRTIRMGLQIAILGVGALLVLRGEMTAGMIFASSIISGRGLQPIDQVIGGWRQFAATWLAWKSLTGAMEKAGDEQQRIAMNPPKGDVSAEGVLVVGPGGMASAPILNRVSFKVNAGDVVGIVGPSGSGKSTLARLLVGAQMPNAGTVRIDGSEISNWDPIQLGQYIGYLGQEVELLPGTVAENIARLAPNPDSAAVLEAAKKAQVHELIQGLPNGYDTLIGPGGTGLSGGQRQRIGLARAFFGNPKIVVLDEPNANLDDDGEVALYKAMQEAREAGVTILMITQRKPILNAVDKILRMHQGTVDFYGTRQQFVDALQAKKESQEAAKAKLTNQDRKATQSKVESANTAQLSSQKAHPEPDNDTDESEKSKSQQDIKSPKTVHPTGKGLTSSARERRNARKAAQKAANEQEVKNRSVQ